MVKREVKGYVGQIWGETTKEEADLFNEIAVDVNLDYREIE